MESLTKKPRKHFWIFGSLVALVLAPVYFIFFYLVGSEVYFKYKEKNINYKNGNVRIYLVNDNPENGSDRYFFRVTVEPKPEYFHSCNLDNFHWDLRRESDDIVLFSTLTLSGQVKKTEFFENKIDRLIFKGLSGKGLGTNNFIIRLEISPENGCGFGLDQLEYVHTMKLERVRPTAWMRAMSV